VRVRKLMMGSSKLCFPGHTAAFHGLSNAFALQKQAKARHIAPAFRRARRCPKTLLHLELDQSDGAKPHQDIAKRVRRAAEVPLKRSRLQFNARRQATGHQPGFQVLIDIRCLEAPADDSSPLSKKYAKISRNPENFEISAISKKLLWVPNAVARLDQHVRSRGTTIGRAFIKSGG